MKKTALLSVLASTLIFAGGDIAPVEPVQQTTTFDETGSTAGSIPMSFGLLGGVTRGDNEGRGDDDADWEGFYGAEFAFPCLFSSDVRSQLQVTNYDQDGLKMLQISANPHYVFNRGSAVEFGFGPHLGAAKVEIADEDDTVFTYGLGASLRSDITEHFYVGAEARFEWTTDATFGGIEDDLNNAKVFAKLGYNF